MYEFETLVQRLNDINCLLGKARLDDKCADVIILHETLAREFQHWANRCQENADISRSNLVGSMLETIRNKKRRGHKASSK